MRGAILRLVVTDKTRLSLDRLKGHRKLESVSVH